MAKLAYSKLKIKTNDTVTIVSYKVDEETSYDIEVKNYLPIDQKLELIGRVISMAADDNKFYNVGKLDILLDVFILYYYTNLSFTDSAKDNVTKLYDEVTSSGLMEIVRDVLIENGEFDWLYMVMRETVESIYKYQDSILGIMDTLSKDYSNIGLEINDLQEKLANPDNLKLLKDTLTKLG